MLFSYFYVFAQMPKHLIVAAENLNFREEPNTKSRVIDQLDNSELLETLKLIEREDWGIYNYNFIRSWIKVRRKATGEIGYVFGKYVLPQNIAYLHYSVVEKIQTGFWYGIHQNSDSTRFYSSLVPLLKKEEESCSGEELLRLYSKNTPADIVFCSQKKLNPKIMIGQIIKPYQGKSLIPIGGEKTFDFSDDLKVIFKSSGYEFNSIGTSFPDRSAKEKITLTLSDPYVERNYDLSKDLLKFGESGYYVNFIGDLNNDGIPDFFLQEATTHGGAFYFFMSNEKGEIELQSITWSSSKC